MLPSYDVASFDLFSLADTPRPLTDLNLARYAAQVVTAGTRLMRWDGRRWEVMRDGAWTPAPAAVARVYLADALLADLAFLEDAFAENGRGDLCAFARTAAHTVQSLRRLSSVLRLLEGFDAVRAPAAEDPNSSAGTYLAALARQSTRGHGGFVKRGDVYDAYASSTARPAQPRAFYAAARKVLREVKRGGHWGYADLAL